MPEDPPELPAEDEDEPEPVAFANPEPRAGARAISEPEPVLEPEKIRPWNGFVHIRCEAATRIHDLPEDADRHLHLQGMRT